MRKIFLLLFSIVFMSNSLMSQSLHEELKNNLKKPYFNLGLLLQALAEYQGENPGGVNGFYATPTGHSEFKE